MEYEKSIRFEGDPMTVIEIAQLIFIQSGYGIIEISDDYIFARHGKRTMKYPSGSTLFGASCVLVSVSQQVLMVRATLQYVEKTPRTIARMMLVILAIGGLLAGFLLALVLNEMWPMTFGVLAMAGISMTQKPTHGFFIPKLIKKRAIQSLDTLVHNLSPDA